MKYFLITVLLFFLAWVLFIVLGFLLFLSPVAAIFFIVYMAFNKGRLPQFVESTKDAQPSRNRVHKKFDLRTILNNLNFPNNEKKAQSV